MAAAVRNADQHLANAALFDDISRSAAQPHHRPTAAIVADFDIAPANAFSPARAERLENRLLGGPAAGEVLRCLLTALAIANLLRGVDAIDEQLAVPFDHLRDPQALDNIRANSKNVQSLDSSRWRSGGSIANE